MALLLRNTSRGSTTTGEDRQISQQNAKHIKSKANTEVCLLDGKEEMQINDQVSDEDDDDDHGYKFYGWRKW